MPVDNLHLYINTPYLKESTQQMFDMYKEVDRLTHLVHLQIIIRHTSPHYHLYILSGVALPNLGSLTIQENEFKSSFLTQLRMILNAPRLRNLTLDSVQAQSILHRDTLQQITELNIDLNTNHLYTYHNILTACPFLDECSIGIQWPMLRILENTPENKIMIACLTILSIEVTPLMLSLLDTICTPALQVLNIAIHLGSNIKADRLIPFICKCLAIVHIDVTGVDVMEEQNNFEHKIRLIHPDVFIFWKNAKRILCIIY